MKKTISYLVLLLITAMISVTAIASPQKSKRSFIQLTVYHYKNKQQEASIDSFLQQSFLPVLHTAGNTKVGVFKAAANDTAAVKKTYVLVPFKSMKEWEKYQEAMDKMYTVENTSAQYNRPAFDRQETVLLKAFEYMPTVEATKVTSPKSERVYELRSYESSTVPGFKNKVKMFNQGGEVSLFSRLGFNAVFYGEVLAGSKMPNLMYMTSFENMKSRDEHWKSFGSDPEWKKLSSMKEYQNNVSHIDITFLRSTDYSDL